MTTTASATTAQFKAATVERLDYVVAQATLIREQLGDGPEMATRDLVDLLALVKKARRSIKGLEIVLEDAAIAGMDSDAIRQIEGAGYTATLHPGGSRKEWRSQDLIGNIVNKFARVSTSRFPQVDADVVSTIVKESIWNFVSLMSPPAWRSRALAGIQISADDYSRREPNMASVEIRGTASYDTYEPDQERADDL